MHTYQQVWVQRKALVRQLGLDVARQRGKEQVRRQEQVLVRHMVWEPKLELERDGEHQLDRERVLQRQRDGR